MNKHRRKGTLSIDMDVWPLAELGLTNSQIHKETTHSYGVVSNSRKRLESGVPPLDERLEMNRRIVLRLSAQVAKYESRHSRCLSEKAQA